MTEEIKEILDRLDFNEWEVDLYKVPITWSELYDIRDYITNLQKENEQLQTELNSHKLKNEKATSLIKRLQKQYGYVLDDLLFLLLQGGDE
jgi:hypothetical protein